MADFSIKSDSVDVEQIMRQIRARIREKRGADYTEAELEQLANVKLERFLDPRGVRSDLVDQFRRRRVVAEAPPNYQFEETTLFETHRGLLRSMRGAHGRLTSRPRLLGFLVSPRRSAASAARSAGCSQELGSMSFRMRCVLSGVAMITPESASVRACEYASVRQALRPLADRSFVLRSFARCYPHTLKA